MGGFQAAPGQHASMTHIVTRSCFAHATPSPRLEWPLRCYDRAACALAAHVTAHLHEHCMWHGGTLSRSSDSFASACCSFDRRELLLLASSFHINVDHNDATSTVWTSHTLNSLMCPRHHDQHTSGRALRGMRSTHDRERRSSRGEGLLERSGLSAA